MRSKTLTTTDATAGATTSEVYVADVHCNPFNIGIGCIVAGTVNFDIEHSFDDPQIPASMIWFNHASIVAKTANTDGNYQFPVRAVRLVQNSGGGSVRAVIIQAGLNG